MEDKKKGYWGWDTGSFIGGIMVGLFIMGIAGVIVIFKQKEK
jgi:hypothetical protein